MVFTSKKLPVFIFSLTLCCCGFSKELTGENLKYVHKALDAKLKLDCYEEKSDKIAFLEKELGFIEKADISEEASLISTTLLKLEIETIKNTPEEEDRKSDKKKKRSERKLELNPETKETVLGCYEAYKQFNENHSDLSSYFYFHFNETFYATMAYMSTKEQLKAVTNMLDDYKKLEERNPDFAETLTMLGTILYVMPGAFGGDKTAGEEKVRRAVEVAQCDYEKSNAYVLYAQLLIENKNPQEAAVYMNKAIEICPENKRMKRIKDANDAGYSIFQMDKYLKENGDKL